MDELDIRSLLETTLDSEDIYLNRLVAFKSKNNDIDETTFCFLYISAFMDWINNFDGKDKVNDQALNKIKSLLDFFQIKLNKLQDSPFDETGAFKKKNNKILKVDGRVISKKIFKELREEFYALEYYEQRLEWWKNNKFYVNDWLHTVEFDKNQISIFPNNSEELGKFNRMLFTLLGTQHPQLRFEEKKIFFLGRLHESPDKKLLIENEIANIEKILSKQKGEIIPILKMFYSGYNLKITGRINALYNHFYPDSNSKTKYLELIDGANTADFVSFLNAELVKMNAIEIKDNKHSSLDLTERMLLINILQECELFPVSNIGSKQFELFLREFLNENLHSINTARKNLQKFTVNLEKQSHKELEAMKKNLTKLNDVTVNFSNLKLSKVIEDYLQKVKERLMK